MAFNPFTWFRKHQKVIFAGLIFLCMVVFIGQFGAGDVFTRALQWFGAGRASGETVTTMYGKKVREGDLNRLGIHRRIASDFLFRTAMESHQKACRDLLDNQLKASEPGNPLSGLREIVQTAESRTGSGLLRAVFSPQGQFLRFQIEQDLNRLEEIAARDKVRNDPDRLDLVRKVATVLGFQYWLTGPTQLQGALAYFRSAQRIYPRDMYFGGGDKTEDLLDFRLWQMQADRLGIQLTDEAVITEVVAEAAGTQVFEPRVPFDSDKGVAAFLDTQPAALRLTARDLMDGLREEFRVVMAQAVLLGSEPGVRAYRLALGATSSPALATPDEFFNFFREQRTTLRVKFLTVPVARYLDRVQEKPSDAELLTRFDRYRDQEPSPTSRDPGFKEPRRVLVEYISASPKDAYYRDMGRGKLFAWAAACVAAGSPLETLAQVVADPLRQEYEQDMRAADSAWFYNLRDSVTMLEDRARKLHFTSVMQPFALASMVGSQMTGSSLLALSSLYGNATFEEVRSSARFTFTQLLANSNPQLLFGNAALIAATLPEQPSYRLMEPQILASVLDRNAEEDLRKNLTKVREEIAKFRGRTAAGKEYITKAAKDYHLKYQSMPEAMTRDAIVRALKKDKAALGLGPLYEAMLKTRRLDRADQFVENALFGEGSQNRTGTYEPMSFPPNEPEKEEFTFWRSQDLPSRPRDFAQVRSDVELAWRTERARQLARKEAERLEDEINKQKLNASDAVRFLNEQKQGEVFELDNIAQLIPPREVLAARRTEYSSYKVPDDKASLFEYPPPDLAKQLLSLKRPGEATVIVDQPAMNFFVAVLQDRSEPTIADFRAVYARTPKEDSLYTFFLAQRRADYRRSVMEQLRRDAAGADSVDRDGKFKIPDAIRRGDSSTREEE